MAEGSIPAPTSFEEPYEVRRLERRTPTIVELELHPLGNVLEYLPGEYVLLEATACEPLCPALALAARDGHGRRGGTPARVGYGRKRPRADARSSRR